MAKNLISSYPNFEQLLRSCISFHETNADRMNSEYVCQKRSRLSKFAETFHAQCGTLTPSVEKSIQDLENGSGIVLMTAHQPNLFAYGGVLRKATLSFVLARELEKRLRIPVVSFFGIADQDFTDDRWVRSCQLPSVKRSGGILSIAIKLPEKKMLNTVAKPDACVIERWNGEVLNWVSDVTRSTTRLCKVVGCSEVDIPSLEQTLRDNFTSFWDIVEDCYERSEKYSDFNSYLMSRIINDVWAYNTVFMRFSECQQVFVDEFNWLLSRSKEYSQLLKEASTLPLEQEETSVAKHEYDLAPFWFHCDCGSKARLSLEERHGSLVAVGHCISCGLHYDLDLGPESDPDISRFAKHVSARAISMPLIFFKGLVPSCYVGGVGGARYLMEAKHVAQEFGFHFPPIVVWRPYDKYRGIGQMEALLEMKRINMNLDVAGFSEACELLKLRIAEIYERCERLEGRKKKAKEALGKNPYDEKLKERLKKASTTQSDILKSSALSVFNYELRVLENVQTVLKLMPSIIDYAVNVGLSETSQQWIHHLHQYGSLLTTVNLNSVLDQRTESTTI